MVSLGGYVNKAHTKKLIIKAAKYEEIKTTIYITN